MIKVLIGDIFASRAKTLVNTVNCVGVMGKGIAKIYKQRFPKMFIDYKRRCDLRQVNLGIPYQYRDEQGANIVNFPTKDHWRSPSRLDDIVRGLEVFVEKYKEWGIESVAFPPLGCGNGGLEWSEVGPLMYQRLALLDIMVEIYAPYGTSKHQLSLEFLTQAVGSTEFVKGHTHKKLTGPWVALLEIIHRLQQQPYSNPVGRTIFQKICYVFTEQGVDTGFQFRQGSYGPFSPEVKEALSVLANANLLVEQQLGRMTALRVGPEYAQARKKFAEQFKLLETKIDKTVDLFSRIKSTEQAEEVTTVIYASRILKNSARDASVSEQDIYDYIFKWKKQWQTNSKRFAIASAIRNLEMLGWLRLDYSESLPFEVY